MVTNVSAEGYEVNNRCFAGGLRRKVRSRHCMRAVIHLRRNDERFCRVDRRSSMPRSRVVVPVLFFACVSVASAQRVAAIDGFLKPIVSKIAAAPNIGGWEWERNWNGGYLLRRWMDVTGDGRSEAFIASTLESDKYGHIWHVFDVSADGIMRPFGKTLRHDSALPVKEDGKTCLLYLPGPSQERMRVSDPKPYEVYRYRFAFPKIEEAFSWVSEEEDRRLGQDYEKRLPKTEVILLADYLSDPTAKWSDSTQLKLDARDRYYLEENKERAEKNMAFTPQVALAKLGGERAKSKEAK
ncbi:hypothetical protein [Luteolibacter soli]|uniref:Uncharacterized protein n=1 Tax=Luteolibacter soli TaxID=3135280 RepID=A0ABU9AUC4_9BACT